MCSWCDAFLYEFLDDLDYSFMPYKSPVYAVINLGSSTISGMVACKDGMGRVIPLGYAEEPSKKSIFHGTVQNIDATGEIITSIIKQLNGCLEENYHIQRVYIGVDCMTLRSHKEKFSHKMNEESTPISQEMLDDFQQRVKEKRYEGREIIHIADPFFTIDSIHTTKPLGVVCRDKFEAHYRLISVRSSIARNIRSVIEDHLHLTLVQILVAPLCESSVVLSPTQKELGCAYINVGGGTTSVAVFLRGCLEQLNVYPFGGINVTKDLTDLKIVEDDAERLKIEHASAMRSSEDRNETVQLLTETSEQPTTYRKIDINNLSSMRMKEIIHNAVAIVGYSEVPKEQLRAGYIFAGGGTKIRNMKELIEMYCSSNYTLIKTIKREIISDEITDLSDSLLYSSDPRFITLLGLALEAQEDCLEVTHKTLSELVESTLEAKSETPSSATSNDGGLFPDSENMEDPNQETHSETNNGGSRGFSLKKKSKGFLQNVTDKISSLVTPQEEDEETPFGDF